MAASMKIEDPEKIDWLSKRGASKLTEEDLRRILWE
jgi:hypothetical protein